VLESAEIEHSVSKALYKRALPDLRDSLLNAQYDLFRSGRGPVILVLSGVEGAGRSETANHLTEWMDPRHIRVVAFGEPTGDEASRPLAWRYWQALPPKGKLGIFMNGWYTECLALHKDSDIGDGALEARLHGIRQHERMLIDEGAVLLKFWIHLSKAQQKQRLEELDSDPQKTWRVTKRDWKAYRIYNNAHPFWEHLLRETSAEAPWTVIPGADEQYRNLTVGRAVLAGLEHAAQRPPARAKKPLAARVTTSAANLPDRTKLIRDLDLRRRVSQAAYAEQLDEWQGRLAEHTHAKRFRRHSLVLVFEGVDAAGKGGAIRRVTSALDARQYITVPVSAPTDEEKAHPYLWRFWRHVPPPGGIRIFDRSWYGRVLVERVEGLAAPADWMRAYSEINQFEDQLVQAGTVLVKFWLQVSKAEQLRRFKAREHTSFKRFKITPDDWRNRKKWDDYELAVCEMVERTSIEIAPWTLVEAEDKRYARIKVLQTIVERLDRALAR
jgi:polyphosphate:AMP phosphotransferase